jgi:hypothetical protein
VTPACCLLCELQVDLQESNVRYKLQHERCIAKGDSSGAALAAASHQHQTIWQGSDQGLLSKGFLWKMKLCQHSEMVSHQQMLDK